MSSPAVRATPLLSLCMIVRDEREHLGQCLASVRGLVDEIIVVDTGSTDGTQEVAREHGARLIQAGWENDFSLARNLSLAEARGRWILVLDADEFLSESDAAALLALVRAHTPSEGSPRRAFGLLQKSVNETGHTGMLVNIVRLFPNRPDVRYAWPIHEQVGTSLARAQIPIEDTGITILHTGYAVASRNRAKQQRNRAILAAQIASGRDVTPLTHFLLAGCHLDLGDPAAALAVYRDAQHLARAVGAADMVTGTTVRIASCLVKLGDFSAVLALASTDNAADAHPEMLNLRALAEEKLGHTEAARALSENVLNCPERAYIPACNVAAEKTSALKALGEQWFHAGRKSRAVALLRAAVALQNEGSAFGPNELAQCYRENP